MPAAQEVELRRPSAVPERVVYEFFLPDGLKDQDEFIKESIGLVKLEMREEITAASNGEAAKIAYGFARIALVEVDGRRLRKADGEDELILNRTDPQIRSLILEAYADISTPDEDIKKSFLKSRRVKVG